MKQAMSVCAVLGLAAVVGIPVHGQEMMDSDLLPPNAKPGECYARVWVSPVYETETKDTLRKEAAEKVEIIPAQYETVEETVTVREASQRLEIVPATYEWVEETMMVKPARKTLRAVPATYETVTEEVIDTPAHTVWKKGRGLSEKVDNTTGEIMCLVEVPATYKTLSKKVLATPARVEEVEIPAEYKTVKRRVMKSGPTTRTVDIPAEFGTVRVTKLVTPPQTRKIEIPASYQTVTTRKLVQEGQMAWKAVLCETNMTPQMVSRIQSALRSGGYDPGPVDNVLGAKTMSAIRSFQGAKGLAQGGVTMETLAALGLR